MEEVVRWQYWFELSLLINSENFNKQDKFLESIPFLVGLISTFKEMFAEEESKNLHFIKVF